MKSPTSSCWRAICRRGAGSTLAAVRQEREQDDAHRHVHHVFGGRIPVPRAARRRFGLCRRPAPADELITAVKRVAAGANATLTARPPTSLSSLPPTEEDPLQKLSNREMEICPARRRRKLLEIANTFGIAYKTVANSCSQTRGKTASKHHDRPHPFLIAEPPSGVRWRAGAAMLFIARGAARAPGASVRTSGAHRWNPACPRDSRPAGRSRREARQARRSSPKARPWAKAARWTRPAKVRRHRERDQKLIARARRRKRKRRAQVPIIGASTSRMLRVAITKS